MPKKYTKKYVKRRTTRRKRYKKRKTNKMMYSKSAFTKQVWTQSFNMYNTHNAPSAICYAAIDCLGGSGTTTLPYSIQMTQPTAQTYFNPAYTEYTVTGVGVKLIFPSAYANPPFSWTMAYSDTAFLPLASVINNPAEIQAIQGSQTGAIPDSHTVSRYFPMATAKRKLGLSYSAVGSVSYYDQLTAVRPYIMVGITSNSNLTAGSANGVSIQLTYYTRYKAKI